MKRRSLTTEAETRESVWGLSFCRLIDPSLSLQPAGRRHTGWATPLHCCAVDARRIHMGGMKTWDTQRASAHGLCSWFWLVQAAGLRHSVLSLSLLSRANVSLNNSLPQSGHSSVCLLRYTQRFVRLAPPRDSAEKPKIRFLSFDGSKHLAIETDLVTLIKRAQTCALFPR